MYTDNGSLSTPFSQQMQRGYPYIYAPPHSILHAYNNRKEIWLEYYQQDFLASMNVKDTIY